MELVPEARQRPRSGDAWSGLCRASASLAEAMLDLRLTGTEAVKRAIEPAADHDMVVLGKLGALLALFIYRRDHLSGHDPHEQLRPAQEPVDLVADRVLDDLVILANAVGKASPSLGPDRCKGLLPGGPDDIETIEHSLSLVMRGQWAGSGLPILATGSDDPLRIAQH